MTLPVPVGTAIAVYVTIWWVTLFAVLPFGVKSQHEDAEGRLQGTDPGAPVAPLLLKKALATTVISAVIFVGLMAYIAYA
ncbi:MAG: DUF1467 family protein [Hyphomicrobiales bacterium]|nr:DUF1467 family protein [Hyphomicrobiales bacterium]